MLEEVKEYLRITWSDDDFLLARLIERGKKKLEELMGAALDFEDEAVWPALFFFLTMYAMRTTMPANTSRRISALRF